MRHHYNSEAGARLTDAAICCAGYLTGIAIDSEGREELVFAETNRLGPIFGLDAIDRSRWRARAGGDGAEIP